MLIGPSSRKRASQKHYDDHLKDASSECPFCLFSKSDKQVVGSTKEFWIIKNIFQYDTWDDTAVLDHLMIVPKRHIVALGEFTQKEIEQFFGIVRKYEKHNYSLYARAPQNITKSVLHQHTHLIKLGNKRNTFKLYIRKPHVLIYK